jgi:signal transduction histidine kinase
VQDTGIGIKEEHLEKIFEKFYRVEQIVHTIPGTGLGLPIVKDLVEKHNGKIWIESKPGKGSIFYFTIPIFTEKKDE